MSARRQESRSTKQQGRNRGGSFASWLLPAASCVLLATACAMNPTPVPVSGAADDVRALAGEWTGEYRSMETGRSGSILFVLGAGKDTAQGSIVMVVHEGNMNRDDAMREAQTRYASNQVLTIRFVQVDGPMVTGTIDPYPSPDCGCELLTVFRGSLSGNRIDGEFQTRHSNSPSFVQKGTWWAERTKK